MNNGDKTSEFRNSVDAYGTVIAHTDNIENKLGVFAQMKNIFI